MIYRGGLSKVLLPARVGYVVAPPCSATLLIGGLPSIFLARLLYNAPWFTF